MSQTDQILNHMKRCPVSGITAAEAVSKYGCYRLAARIGDLERRGHGIEHIMEKGINRDGRRVIYTRYRLIGDVSK